MHRLYCPYQNISGNTITLNDKKQVHHLKDVLRLEINEQVIIFDDRGNEYICSVKGLQDNEVIMAIKEKRASSKSEAVKITLACAIPKKSKMDDIIDKLTQLGVERIIPLLTERVIIKLDRNKEALRLTRWKKIALNASEQCQRNTLPIIEMVKNIKEVLLERGDYDLKLIPTLIGERKALKEILTKSKPKNILVLIGPEGDFSAEEIDLAEKAGCIAVSLGDLVLRVETAAVAIVSFIRLYEDS